MKTFDILAITVFTVLTAVAIGGGWYPLAISFVGCITLISTNAIVTAIKERTR